MIDVTCMCGIAGRGGRAVPNGLHQQRLQRCLAQLSFLGCIPAQPSFILLINCFVPVWMIVNPETNRNMVRSPFLTFSLSWQSPSLRIKSSTTTLLHTMLQQTSNWVCWVSPSLSWPQHWQELCCCACRSTTQSTTTTYNDSRTILCPTTHNRFTTCLQLRKSAYGWTSYFSVAPTPPRDGLLAGRRTYSSH